MEWPATTPVKHGETVELGSVISGRVETRQATLILRNTGNAALTGLTATLLGSNASMFAVLSPPASVVNAGGSTTVTVQYLPFHRFQSGGPACAGARSGPVNSPFSCRLHDPPGASSAL